MVHTSRPSMRAAFRLHGARTKLILAIRCPTRIRALGLATATTEKEVCQRTRALCCERPKAVCRIS